MNKGIIRKEGEYPFYPIKPEYEVMKSLSFISVYNEETGEERITLDYSSRNQEDTSILQSGKDF